LPDLLSKMKDFSNRPNFTEVAQIANILMTFEHKYLPFPLANKTAPAKPVTKAPQPPLCSLGNFYRYVAFWTETISSEIRSGLEEHETISSSMECGNAWQYSLRMLGGMNKAQSQIQ
jgi:hypothetical protein